MPDETEPSIESALAAFVTEAANEDECRALAQTLAEQPALRSELAKQLLLDRLLHTMGQPALKADVILRALPARSSPLSGRVMARIDLARIQRRFWIHAALTAATIFLVLGIVYALVARRDGTPSESPIAQITGMEGDVVLLRNGQRQALSAAQTPPLHRGDTLESSANGSAQLRYADGTTLQLRPDSLLSISIAVSNAGPQQPRLERGSFTVVVAKQSPTQPMRFETKWATVEVLGTEFELSLESDAATVRVLEGRVRFTSLSSRESRDLERGERGTIGAEGGVRWEYSAPRDPTLWPFASHSPWNVPLGSGAQFIAATSENFSLTRGAKVNLREFGHPVYFAAPDDPERLVEKSDGTPLLRTRIPENAQADPSQWGALHVIDPRSRTALELTGVERRADGVLRTKDFAVTDLAARGFATESIRVSGASGLGGLIRRGELRDGIHHVLALSVIRKALHRKTGPGTAFVWPATRAPLSYGIDTPGPRQLGTLLALPPDLDITKLGIGDNGPAYQVARALQDYGGYIVESFQDANNDLDFFVEPAAENEIPPDFNAQLSRIIPHLKIVSNNGPERVGGGGVPRRPYARPIETSKRDADF